MLTYPDGSRKHIDKLERDSLLVDQLARQTAPRRYLYVGPTHTYHSLSELKRLRVVDGNPLQAFLRGLFVFEFEGKRRLERMETPERMAMRLADLEPLEAT